MPYRDPPSVPRVYVATNGHVLALRADTGVTLWRTPIRRPDPLSRHVTLLPAARRVFAACLDTVVCLDEADGTVSWRSAQPGLPEPAALALSPAEDLVLVAAAGRVFALDVETGFLRWQNDLPGLGYGPVTLRVAGGVSSGATARSVLVGSVMTTLVEDDD